MLSDPIVRRDRVDHDVLARLLRETAQAIGRRGGAQPSAVCCPL